MNFGLKLEAYRRLVVEWILIALLLVTFAAFASWRGWLTPENDQLFDLALSFTQRPVPQDVVIIAIDDSIAELGKWPWRRDVHAALVDTLTRDGTSAIALDLLFTETDPDGHAYLVLVEAIRRSGRVVLPVFHGVAQDWTRREMVPVPLFSQAAAGLGHLDASIDVDGVMRGYTRFAAESATPHMAIRILDVAARRASSQSVSITPVASAVKQDAVPKQGEFRRIPFLGPSGSIATRSYADVLKGQIPAGHFKDKIVLVGAYGAGMGDFYSVPATRGRGPMPVSR